MLCGLADAIESLSKNGVSIQRVLLIGGAARTPAVAAIASAIFGREGEVHLSLSRSTATLH